MRRAVVALILLLVLSVPSETTRGAAGLQLQLKPNPVYLGQPFFVILRGLKSGETATFTATPARTGSGNTSMGRHTASQQGIIAFRHPPFNEQRNIGSWTISARRNNGQWVSAALVVENHPTPQPLPSSPPPVSSAPRWRIPLAQPTYARSALSGSSVVWATQSCRTCKIALVLAQLSHPNPRALIQLSPQVRLLDLHLSTHWLVWVQANYPTLGWRLRSLNLQSDAQRLLASSTIEGGPAAPGYPSLFLQGDQLVWVRHDCRDRCSRPGPSALNVTNLATGSTRLVVSTTDSCRPIDAGSLAGGTLSWVREPLSVSGCRPSASFTIVARDMGTGATTRRTVHLMQPQVADEFAGYGRNIAWVQHRQYTDEDSTVVLFETQTGRSQIIARNGAYGPMLAGRTLAWKGTYGDTVEARDLVTGKHYLLARSYETSGDAVSTGSWLGYSTGDRILWEESHYDPNGSARHDYLTVAQVP